MTIFLFYRKRSTNSGPEQLIFPDLFLYSPNTCVKCRLLKTSIFKYFLKKEVQIRYLVCGNNSRPNVLVMSAASSKVTKSPWGCSMNNLLGLIIANELDILLQYLLTELIDSKLYPL